MGAGRENHYWWSWSMVGEVPALNEPLDPLAMAALLRQGPRWLEGNRRIHAGDAFRKSRSISDYYILSSGLRRGLTRETLPFP